MRTPLTVATGLVLLAGVAVGVTTTAASADGGDPAVQPIRVESPPVPGAVADVTTVVPVVPELPVPEIAPQQAPRQETAPRDANGYVAPPPADDDDDDDDDDDRDDDLDDDADDGDD
jgi:hypothetical protein